jgi:tetratricopeptide (TPR) repeat protein
MPEAKSRRRKVTRKARQPAEPRTGPKAEATRGAPTNGGSEWSDLADRAAKKVRELADRAGPAAERMAVDVSEGLDGAFAKVSEQARNLMSKGQHTRVRIKFRGKQIAELPIAVVAAAEVASFWWFGPLRVVLGHVVGKAILAEFDKALAMDRRHAGALLGKGIALKLKGDKAAAREWFQKAEDADPRSDAGREARRHLDNL